MEGSLSRTRELLRSEAVDVDDRLRKGLRRFLRQVMTDPAYQSPMRILARKLLGVGAGIQLERLSSPASTCFSGPNELFVLPAGASAATALVNRAAARVIAVAASMRRRFWLMISVIEVSPVTGHRALLPRV
jgi:hypothetical protein